MRLLVDTHAFIWLVAGDARLSKKARRAIESNEGSWYLSTASVWEMAVKSSREKLTLPLRVDEFIADKVRSGLALLAIDWQHAAAVERLPFHHKDPVDRLLVAQAKAEHLRVVTQDPVFEKYGVDVVW